MKRYEISFDSFLANFKKSVARSGYKNSIQKDYILKILYFSDEHLSAEQIVNISKSLYKIDMGIATVYRTVKFFETMNIVKSLDIGDGTKRYELNISIHHDHMICTNCNKIIEFTDDLIEDQQEKVAKKHNFKLKDHIMTIYGICEDCQK
ncbi:Fur family transcriptional regulator [Arcobacter sp. YIC-464]|uniref:Fur family transcriptional regulator n=1 Tax=Arcobacter sp. YIC-464 TaxID=3376631 RepID=UPI003C1FF580